MCRRPVPRPVLLAAVATTLLLATPPLAPPAEPQAPGAAPSAWRLR